MPVLGLSCRVGVADRNHLWRRRTCLYLASRALCVSCHAYDWRRQPHHSLASTAAPNLGIDGRGSPFLWQLHLCLAWVATRLSLAWAAAPMLGVGNRANDWRQRPLLSLVLTVTPFGGVSGHTCARLCRSLALMVTLLLGVGDHCLHLALAAAPLLGVGIRAYAWHWRPHLCLAPSTATILDSGGRDSKIMLLLVLRRSRHKNTTIK